MVLPNLVFSVASEYDGKGLGKARKDISKFDKTVKNLARSLGVTLSVAGVVQFGRSSVKAFSDAEREGVLLTNTMKNLGLAFATPQIDAYIQSVGKLYGVTGGQAVPAMQALLSATGSVTKAQELFNTALNISASTGIDVAQVAKGLSQAYLGNKKALAQYNTGLTKAEIQLKSFDELQKILDTRLKGSATAAAATYSGQMLILAENAEQAKEVIGEGLIDAFKILAGDTTTADLSETMGELADNTARALTETAKLIKLLSSPISFATDSLLSLVKMATPLLDLLILGDPSAIMNYNKPKAGAAPTRKLIGQQSPGERTMAVAAAKEAEKRAKTLRKIEQDRLNNLKKITAEQNKKLALDKASAVLNQANKLFDMERISLAAAAMAKQTDEDRVRIRLKTNILELEDAINQGNVQSAAKFASLITQDAALLGQLRGLMVGLGDIPNPFAEWLATLEKMLAMLMAVPMVKPVTTYTPNFQPFTPAPGGYEGFGSGLSDMGTGNYGGLAGAGRYGGGGAPVVNVVVNNAGSTITERDLVDTITQGIYNNQAAGIPINYSTVY
jgi:hypothetical protein